LLDQAEHATHQFEAQLVAAVDDDSAERIASIMQRWINVLNSPDNSGSPPQAD
jgi:hypothetical protein